MSMAINSPEATPPTLGARGRLDQRVQIVCATPHLLLSTVELKYLNIESYTSRIGCLGSDLA